MISYEAHMSEEMGGGTKKGTYGPAGDETRRCKTPLCIQKNVIGNVARGQDRGRSHKATSRSNDRS